MTPEEWIVGADSGLSSVTIWAVMMGVTPARPFPPSDPADFGRCSRLLAAIPVWRERLPEVAAKYPEWAPLIQEWLGLEDLYREEVTNQLEAGVSISGLRAPLLYHCMTRLLNRTAPLRESP